MAEPDTLFELLRGDQVFIADLPDLIPEDLVLPDNFKVVGPLTWTGWERDDNFPVEKFRSKPVLYITMGSTIDAETILLKLIQSVCDLPYNIIISTGSIPPVLSEVPDNVHLFSYVPGNYVASISSLVIYHGGHETLMQVLACGIPSLVIPVNPDQILVARQIRMHGLGDYLKYPGSFPMEKDPLKKFTPDVIASSVKKIITDPKYQEKCRAMASIMNEFISQRRFIQLL